MPQRLTTKSAVSPVTLTMPGVSPRSLFGTGTPPADDPVSLTLDPQDVP